MKEKEIYFRTEYRGTTDGETMTGNTRVTSAGPRVSLEEMAVAVSMLTPLGAYYETILKEIQGHHEAGVLEEDKKEAVINTIRLHLVSLSYFGEDHGVDLSGVIEELLENKWKEGSIWESILS